MIRTITTETITDPSLHLPDDFCRTCRGTGVLYDQDYRPGVGTVTVAQDCWACDGTGWGK